ncbi:MAG: type-F conjugative transfer system secretin TraK [Nitrospiraceae bacterium]|nr:type-F conjugative transfer system secretin TraK [Nitrospiraceae bacterium]
MRVKAFSFSLLFLLLFQAGVAFAADKTSGPVPAWETFMRSKVTSAVNAGGPSAQVKPEPPTAKSGVIHGMRKPASPAVANTPSAAGQLATPGEYSSIPADSLAVVPPEVATPVYLSSSDINRIVCPSYIKDVIYSKEKGLTVKIEGQNAFVKFLVTKEGDKDEYSTTPTELYVLCGKETYNLIALPKRIPSRTVTLSGGDRKTGENASLFDGMPFEKKILSIIKSVYTENIPDSFTVRNEDRPFNPYKGLNLTLVRTVRVEGEGLRVKEFTARAAQTMELSEKDFLKTEITTDPVAIVIDKLRLTPGETARIFIVERVTAEGGN